MRYKRLDLNLLVALDALLKHQHVTHAAQELYMTQSGMSSSLSRLREMFNDPLIVRVGRRNTLTPLATSLVEPVREVLIQTNRLLSERPGFDPARSDRQFSIICTDYVCDVLMDEVVTRVAAVAPHVRIVLEGLRDDTIHRFKAGEVEFLIIRDELALASHPREPLFTDNYVCIAWSGNRAVGASLSQQDFLTLTHVDRVSEWSVSTQWQSTLQENLPAARKVAVQTSPFMVPRMVVGTQHIATIQQRAAVSAAKHLPLRILPAPVKFPPLRLALSWQRHQVSDPAVLWLRGVIREVAAQLDATPDTSGAHADKELKVAAPSRPRRSRS